MTPFLELDLGNHSIQCTGSISIDYTLPATPEGLAAAIAQCQSWSMISSEIEASFRLCDPISETVLTDIPAIRAAIAALLDAEIEAAWEAIQNEAGPSVIHANDQRVFLKLSADTKAALYAMDRLRKTAHEFARAA